MKARILTDEEIHQIIALGRAAIPVQEISRRLKRSTVTIYRILKAKRLQPEVVVESSFFDTDAYFKSNMFI